MNEAEAQPYRDKAIESLAGAEAALAGGRHNNVANRAYYAAYHAAIAALIEAGFSNDRWPHETVSALFSGQLISRRKLYPSEMRSVLQSLRRFRNRADYGTQVVSRRQAEAAVREAQRFVRLLLPGIRT